MKKFSYIDKDSGDKHYGDVAISDVPLLNDKVVNYDSHLSNNDIHVTAVNKSDWNAHVADTVRHVTGTDKTSWNGHIANNDIHVTLAKKTSWDNHIADSNIHVTTAEKALWNSGGNGLKPFTNCFYVDSSFTNSAPYFNNLTSAMNASSNSTLIIVNGAFDMPTALSGSATVFTICSAFKNTSTLRFNATYNFSGKTFNFIDLATVYSSSKTLNCTINIYDCGAFEQTTISGTTFKSYNTPINFVTFSQCPIVSINNSLKAQVSFERCNEIELINIPDLRSNLTYFISTLSTDVLPKIKIIGCNLYISIGLADAIAIRGTGSNIGFKIRFINSMFIASGDTGRVYRVLRYVPDWTGAPLLLTDNCVFSGENDTGGELISGIGRIYSRNSLIVGTCSAPIEGELTIGNRSYADLGF